MAGRSTLTVAAAQYPIDRPESFEALAEKLARWTAEGAATGAELLVYPEYGAMEAAAIAGPQIAADLDRSLSAVADLMPRLDALHAALARKHRVHILAASGPAHGASGRIVNRASLFTPTGRSGGAEKSIMTPFEIAWGVSPGSGGIVFDTALGRIGVAICYDSEFPLLVRAQVEAGAEIVLVPSCTERVSGYARVRIAAMARALECQIATVMSPTVGEAEWSPAVDRNAGAAGIFVPPEHGLSDTGALAEGTLNAPGWVTGTIRLDALARVRTAGEMRNRDDWRLQAGAASLDLHARVIDLKG
jgi:predicted amidohydrolase